MWSTENIVRPVGNLDGSFVVVAYINFIFAVLSGSMKKSVPCQKLQYTHFSSKQNRVYLFFWNFACNAVHNT